MKTRDRYLLRAAAIWTIWVWTTRIYNIVRDDHSVGFKAVHSILAVISIVFAVIILRIASRDGTAQAS